MSVSLFPFLAVLICTMGALILLLVVIARQARVQAAQAAATKAVEEKKDLEAERETIDWRIEQLENSRNQTEAQLVDARLELGHIEDHARRLRDQLARLQGTLDALERPDHDDSRQREELTAQIRQLKEEIAQTERRLSESRRAAEQRRRSFAVVPYRGPHETHRRPIYIECRADSIVLQPEGIVLDEDDFLGPMGPGNPLAAALRATREYLLSQGELDPEQSGEPYPLLLVRPDGIAAYYAARTAMKSWGSEFGYELIGEDWKLEFSAPDPQLARVTRRAVDTARVRQMQMVAAAPRHYRNANKPRYRVRNRGIGVDGTAGTSAARGQGFQRPRASGAVARRYGSPGQPQPGQASSREGQAAKRSVPLRPPRESAESTTAHATAVKRPGQWQPKDESAGDHAGQRPTDQQVESLAGSRGKNWGLPDASRGSTPLTRPIRIECHADRLVVAPERGRAGGKAIPLGPRTVESVDEFVSSVWEHMDGWGIAGKGMYWRPVLSVRVAPGAQQRYAELEQLLKDSGLTMERK